MMVLVQSSFHTTWASLFEMELEPNLLDWNVNELERELELEDMKRTHVSFTKKCASQMFLDPIQKRALSRSVHLEAVYLEALLYI